MKDMLPLFKSYPRLEENIAWIALGNYPSPVEKLSNLGRALGVNEIWIKRDDLLSGIYGGNKVRKLEFILADARSITSPSPPPPNNQKSPGSHVNCVEYRGSSWQFSS